MCAWWTCIGGLGGDIKLEADCSDTKRDMITECLVSYMAEKTGKSSKFSSKLSDIVDRFIIPANFEHDPADDMMANFEPDEQILKESKQLAQGIKNAYCKADEAAMAKMDKWAAAVTLGLKKSIEEIECSTYNVTLDLWVIEAALLAEKDTPAAPKLAMLTPTCGSNKVKSEAC